LATAASLLLGCDSGAIPTQAAQEVSASGWYQPPPAPSAPEIPDWEKMPPITVEEFGIVIGGRRVDLKKKDALPRLREIAAKLPIKDEPVPVLADRKARTSDVATLVDELGAKGATAVLLKTAGRGDLPGEIAVVPRTRIGGTPAPCSVAVTVTDDLSTGVWPISGGGGKKHRKGFAGPDLSNTGETLVKAIDACDSKTAFFSANEKHAWELCFNMGALIVKSDTGKKIDKLVLLGDAPVAGREIKLEGG
jgi:hypothetical protein